MRGDPVKKVGFFSVRTEPTPTLGASYGDSHPCTSTSPAHSISLSLAVSSSGEASVSVPSGPFRPQGSDRWKPPGARSRAAGVLRDPRSRGRFPIPARRPAPRPAPNGAQVLVPTDISPKPDLEAGAEATPSTGARPTPFHTTHSGSPATRRHPEIFAPIPTTDHCHRPVHESLSSWSSSHGASASGGRGRTQGSIWRKQPCY